MDTLLLMLLLQIKHCYADFGIQTYDQTVKKGIYGDWVGITHTLDHVWTSWISLLVFSFFVPINFWSLVLLPVVEGIIHYHIDWSKVRFGTKDIKSPLFWKQFGLDQLAHQLTYLAMILYLVK